MNGDFSVHGFASGSSGVRVSLDQPWNDSGIVVDALLSGCYSRYSISLVGVHSC
jgi:hypothetical protein